MGFEVTFGDGTARILSWRCGGGHDGGGGDDDEEADKKRERETE